MTFTFVTNMVIGLLSTGVSAILALTGIPAGSLVLGGHMFFDTTNNANPAIYVGTQQVLNPTAGGLSFPSNGTQSGVVLKTAGLERYQTFPTTCIGTGGLTGVYNTCAASSPYSSTGTLLGVSIECGNWMVSQVGDVSFKKTVHGGTGASLTNLVNVTVATGANITSMLAQPVSWNPTDTLTFSTITASSGVNSAARFDCKMYPVVLNKYGS